MNYQHEVAPWLAIVVLALGISSVTLLGVGPSAEEQATVRGDTVAVAKGQSAPPTVTRMALAGFRAVAGDLPTMVAEPPIFTPIPTPTVIPSPTTVPPLELPNVPVPEGGQMYLLTPMQAEVVGWAREADEEINHFGDFNIFAGNFEGQQHVGAMQFDLTTIPVGSPILYADLTMTGLADEWLGSDGTWSVELLAEWMDRDWPTRNFHWLNRPDSALAALDPVMSAGELAVGRANTFFLPIDLLPRLEARLFQGKISFRVNGPRGDNAGLFAWDSGFGTRTIGRGPVLRIVTGGPAPATPPPSPTPDYVVVTLTPMDERALLAAAVNALTATAAAPPELANSTPAPTATATPLPPNWVTPIVVTNTPTPETRATAVWRREVATAEAIVQGTATATPPNVWTATATPLPPPPTATPMIVLQNLLTPTATPTATPPALPGILRGKILFFSDRNGGTNLMVMDPNGANVAVWTGGDPDWIYQTAKRGEEYAPGGAERVIVSSEQIRNSQLWVVDLATGRHRQLTYFNAIAYDPVWSPRGDHIVFVSPEPGNDELYTINPDGTNLQRLTFNDWEWDKHPSWSPDGSQIVFWSNRETKRKQIWIMNVDGSNVRNLSNNPYNDWEPVWVK